MPVIDFHNHYYPPAYLDALRSKPTSVKVGVDAEGNPIKDDSFLLLVNAYHEGVEFTLPPGQKGVPPLNQCSDVLKPGEKHEILAPSLGK